MPLIAVAAQVAAILGRWPIRGSRRTKVLAVAGVATLPVVQTDGEARNDPEEKT